MTVYDTYDKSPSEGLFDFVFWVHVPHQPPKEVDKLSELDDPRPIYVYFVDHVVDLAVGGVLAHGP